MSSLHSVTVYCSSSRHVPAVYFDAASELGTAIARAKWDLIYGGNLIGSMGALADAARAAGGRVIGITPELLVREGIADNACSELIVTDTMRERKALLEERGDAFVALPGGLGTFEEVFEILVAKLLGYHQKPIVLLNVADYYAPLLAMVDHGIEQRFIKPTAREAYFVAGSVTEAMEFLARSGGTAPATVEPSAAE
ncbi:MAG TPA: TIGR00730 family Rossman fold protein [Tepidisphaeraceae bacterium]|jgi:hypothetical protein